MPNPDRSTSVRVAVPVAPKEAFRLFTEEIDRWWVRGPINFFDAARAVGMHIESGVGGRLLELYDPDGVDARVLGRITIWQPPAFLEWVSPDGVTTRVSFAPNGEGSLVEVRATLPDGVPEHTETFWLRVIPPWFGAWCERRDERAPAPTEISRLAVNLSYPDPRETAR